MKLITKRLEELIEKSGYYPEVDELMEAPVLVKYFNPTGAGTWLIVGGEKIEGEWILYGCATLGYGWEWGSIALKELEAYNGPFGLGIERDLHCNGKTVRELMRE